MLHSDSFWKAQSSGGRKQRPARGWLASRLAATACKGGLFSCAVLDNDTGGQGEMWGEKHCLAARICTFGTWVTIRPDDGRRNMLAAVSCRQLSGTGSMFDTHTPACSCVYLCMRWSSLGSRPAAPSASGWATQGVWRKREGSGSPASTRSSGFFFRETASQCRLPWREARGYDVDLLFGYFGEGALDRMLRRMPCPMLALSCQPASSPTSLRTLLPSAWPRDERA